VLAMAAPPSRTFLNSVSTIDYADFGTRSFPTSRRLPSRLCFLCRQSRQFDWWTLLDSSLTDSYKNETKSARQQARKDLEDENKGLPAKIRQIRGG
jgi:hypothetical protein